MSKQTPREYTGRVVGLAIALSIGAASLGLAAEVHNKLSSAELVALGVFAALFAVGTYFADTNVREWVRSAFARSPAASRGATSAPRTSARGSGVAGVPGEIE